MGAQASEPALRAEGVYKTFGADETLVRALSDVNLSLARGQVIALLGPSGSGKSTLIKALGLVSLPERGRIWMAGTLVADEGIAMADLGELRRQHLGFVFQKPNLIPFLTARQNVQVACEIGGQANPRRRADELLTYLEVAHRADSMPATLSGGEQQRIAIARALANHPALIFADEPTAALDKARGRQVMELFARIAHEQGAAVLVVTHDHRTLDVFDAQYEMEDGRLTPAKGATERALDAAHQLLSEPKL
jgi:putative ABC transport system ATP-binding protein